VTTKKPIKAQNELTKQPKIDIDFLARQQPLQETTRPQGEANSTQEGQVLMANR